MGRDFFRFGGLARSMVQDQDHAAPRRAGRERDKSAGDLPRKKGSVPSRAVVLNAYYACDERTGRSVERLALPESGKIGGEKLTTSRRAVI